jgi:uncharacterized protein (TIGR01244 family)
MTARVAAFAFFLAFTTMSTFAQVQKKDVPGVTNYSRVDATIGCGGATTPAAMTELKKEGYRSVINLRLESEPGADIAASRAAAEAAGLKYIHLPFNAAAPDSTVVDRFLATVADTRNQPVFIHCGSANRVGGVWLIKRVLQDHWTIERARAEADAIGLRDPKLVAFASEYIATHQ